MTHPPEGHVPTEAEDHAVPAVPAEDIPDTPNPDEVPEDPEAPPVSVASEALAEPMDLEEYPIDDPRFADQGDEPGEAEDA